MNGSPSTSSHPDVEDCVFQCQATLKFSSLPTDYNLMRKDNFQSLAENLNYLEKRFDKISKEKKVELKLKAKLADLTEKLKKQQQVNEKLELTVHESNKQNQELHSKMQTLTSWLKDEKENNQELQGTISHLEDKNQTLRTNLKTTSNQLQVEQQNNQAMKNGINELKNEVEQQQKHVEKITTQFDHTQKSLEEQLKKNALEISNLKTEGQQKENNLSETAKSLKKCQLKLQEMTADRDALNVAINKQNEVIRQNENKIKDLVEENEQLLTQIETLENKISKLSVIVADGVVTADFIDILTKMKNMMGNSLEEEEIDCKDEISSILERLTFLVQCVQEWGSEIDRISMFSKKVRNIAASPLTLGICSVLLCIFAVLFLYNDRKIIM